MRLPVYIDSYSVAQIDNSYVYPNFACLMLGRGTNRDACRQLEHEFAKALNGVTNARIHGQYLKCEVVGDVVVITSLLDDVDGCEEVPVEEFASAVTQYRRAIEAWHQEQDSAPRLRSLNDDESCGWAANESPRRSARAKQHFIAPIRRPGCLRKTFEAFAATLELSEGVVREE